LTSGALLEVEPPCRTNGFCALSVRGAGTAVVVDVDQSWGKNVPRAVDNIGVALGEVTPGATGAGGKDPTISECDESVGAVQTLADQPN
jgi:hypothetical protein